jgi:hypothetical protein
LIIASRPRTVDIVIKQNNKGIDIVMAVDVSVCFKDLKPNRMEG